MRKSLITLAGLAAAAGITAAALAGCGTAASHHASSPAAPAPAATAPAQAGPTAADSALTRLSFTGGGPLTMRPGMTGIASAAYGFNGNAEEVAVVYDTPADVAAVLPWYQAQAAALGLAGIIVVQASPQDGPAVVTIIGDDVHMARYVGQITGPAPVATAPAPLPVLAAGGFDGTRPGFIGFSGDGGNVIENITWSSWGPASASGTGTSFLQDCVPNCAQGTTTQVTATITLSAPAAGRFTWYTEARNGQQVGSGPVSEITGARQYGPTPAAPAASPPPVSGDPVAGTGTGPACVTPTNPPGYFPGGEAGHRDSTGFCVPDRGAS